MSKNQQSHLANSKNAKDFGYSSQNYVNYLFYFYLLGFKSVLILTNVGKKVIIK